MNLYYIHNIQLTLLVLTAMLAFVLAVSSMFTPHQHKIYEKSRWVLFSAMLLLVLHFALQMGLGLRERGDDLSTVFNFLFFAPIASLTSLSQLLLQNGGHKLRHYWTVSITTYILILGIIAFGYWHHPDWHFGWELHIINTVYLASILHYIFMPAKDLRLMLQRIEEETVNSSDVYVQCIRWGLILIYLFALFVNAALFYLPLLLIMGPILMLSYAFYVVCFVCLGFNMGTVAEVIDAVVNDACLPQESPKDEPVLDAKSEEMLNHGLEQWLTQGGLRDSNASLTSVSRHLGVSRAKLSAYLAIHHDCTFRVWLSTRRLEFAKKLILEHPEYNNEVIAQDCGFLSTSQLYRLFRADTGFTPGEWSKRKKL